MLTRYAEEIRSEGFDDVSQEKMEQILEEIIEKDGLENEELATEYFELMWQKIEKSKFLARPGQPKFNEIDPVRGAPYHKQHEPERTDYQSIIPADDEMILDRENNERRNNWLLNNIGRYPKSYLKFENYANYS